MITDRLIERIIELQNPTCVGLDTSFDYLPDDMRAGAKNFSDVAERIFDFNKKLIDTLYDVVPSVKVQIAYYEMYGAEGLKAYEATLKYAAEKGLVVIADAKRNDIGSTAACYSKAFLGETEVNGARFSAFPSDFLTVNGYLGTDGIAPFVEDCTKRGKGIFVLVKTSNPSSGELQNLLLENGTPVYEYMGGLVEKWGEPTAGRYGYSAVGAVVGATHPAEAASLRAKLPHTFFLIPGYGAQGAGAKDAQFAFDRMGHGAAIMAGRSILYAFRKQDGDGQDYQQAALQAAEKMKKQILSYITVM